MPDPGISACGPSALSFNPFTEVFAVVYSLSHVRLFVTPGIVNKAEVDVVLEFSCFSYDPMDVGNLISGSSSFSKISLTSGSSRFMYC